MMQKVLTRSQTSEPQIFLVEDDDGAAKSVERQLRKAELDTPVVRAFDGIDALNVLQGKDANRRLGSPFVTLVDLNMPRLGGIALIRHITAERWADPSRLFVMTTSRSEHDQKLVEQLGVAGYLVKGDRGSESDGFNEILQCLSTLKQEMQQPSQERIHE